MINVLIPAPDKASADGNAYADAIGDYELSIELHVQDDCSVRVVPSEALQSLLNKSRSFATYEKRFGHVSNSDKANIRALFSLIEFERTFDPTKRQEFDRLTLIKRREQRKESPVKRSPEESEKMARFLANH